MALREVVRRSAVNSECGNIVKSRRYLVHNPRMLQVAFRVRMGGTTVHDPSGYAGGKARPPTTSCLEFMLDNTTSGTPHDSGESSCIQDRQHRLVE